MFTLGGVLNIILFLSISKLIRSWGNMRTMLVFIVLEFFALLGLATSTTPAMVALFFITHQALPSILLYHLDIFLEYNTKNDATGHVRGTYLTIISGVMIISPVFVGSILTHYPFTIVYLLSSSFLLPLILVVLLKLNRIPDPAYRALEPLRAFKKFVADGKLRKIFIANFLLQSFYAVMVIYMGIYLSTTIGLSWDKIGIIFTVMLIPFLIDEFPLGRIADRKLGEKEILLTGFLIMSLVSFVTPHIRSSSVLVWMILLFISRIGASFAEIASETYFFKQVDASDAQFISLYRTAVPLSYIIAPLLAGGILVYFSFSTIFTILGATLFVGFLYLMKLKDTR